MVATDGHRLAFVEKSTEGNGIDRAFRALVPRKAMAEIVKLAEQAGEEAKTVVAGDENHLFFKVGDRLLLTRKLTGNFPDYERVLPQGGGHLAVLSRDEVRGAIERVAQFADERSRSIRVQFTAGEMKVFSSSVETGESEESVPAEYDGPDMEIGFNAQYLLDFLRAVPQAQVAFELKDQKSAGEMRPAGEAQPDRYRYVVMPMRI
jgi:DNA polymerase-3 subunit beta